MLFMVIERFRDGDPRRVGERFRASGRMMPEGVAYVASWMTSDGAACYQLMETGERALLEVWMDHWRDLVDFKVVAVEASADYWRRVEAAQR